MVKQSLFVVAAAMALTSCSQDELLNSPDNQMSDAIGVNVYVPSSSRGVAYENGEQFKVEDQTFDLIAYSESGLFMGTATDGVEFKYNGSVWDYTNKAELRFWQEASKNSTLNFYAVTPSSKTDLSKNIGAEEQTITYTVPTTCDDQVDLMYAVETVSIDGSGNPTQQNGETSTDCKNGITLNFKHALSQILFSAKTTDASLTADINSVTIQNVKNKGKFTIGSTSWNLEETTASYVATLSDNTGIGSTVASLSNSSSALLLLPQSLSGINLVVNCKIYHKNTAVSSDAREVFSGNVTVALNNSATWEAGKKYIYTLVLSNDLTDNIKVTSTTVNSWDANDSNNSDINVKNSTI